MKIRDGNLNIVIPIDISHIKPHINNINLVLGTYKFLCRQIDILEHSECYNMVEPLSVRYQDLVREFDSISHLIDGRTKRSAWIGAGGSILKTVFGSLDENDAIKYDKVMNSLQSNEKKLASLIKQNILITSSTLSNYNQTIHRINMNEANLNLAIDELSANLKNVTFISNKLLIFNKMDSILNRLETAILVISFQLEDITNAVLLSSKNIIHPSVITPMQLYRELADNHLHLSPSVRLPVALELNNMFIILSMSRVISYYYNGKIVFVVKVPLVNPEEYSVYRNLPLPIPHDSVKPNTYSLIIPSSTFIAMTKDKTRYCMLNKLDKCESANPECYICDVPSVLSSTENPTCESELITRVVRSLPVQCETKTIFGHVNIWNAMRHNKWIYVQSEALKLTIDCEDSKVYNLNILGTGILSLPVYCSAYSKSTRLVPKFDYDNVSLTIMNTDFNLINESCCNLSNIRRITSNVSPIKLENINLENLSSNEKLIKNVIDSTEEILNEESFLNKYGTHYAINTVTFIIILIFIFLAYKLYKHVKSGSSLEIVQPIASIRQNSRRPSESQSELSAPISSPRLRVIS